MNFLMNNFIADGFEWLLENTYKLIPNYIVVVILILVIIKVLLTPLDIKQRESSMKLGKLTPKIAEIKKRYPDPQTQAMKTKELYRKENVKMTGGCLPSILQMIILIAFFGALQKLAYNQIVRMVIEASENPGQPITFTSFLWVKNLWQPDSGSALVMPELKEWTRILQTVSPEIAETAKNLDYMAVIQPTLDAYSGFSNGWYILPLIQGVTMYFSFSYSLSTAPGAQDNPMGGPMFRLIMAGITTWFCLTANTLFTIYWIITNLLMFAQTYVFKLYFAYKEKKAQQVLE